MKFDLSSLQNSAALRWFRDLRLTYKFAALLVIMVLNIVAVGFVGVVQLRSLGNLSDEMQKAQAIPQERMREIERAFSRSRMLLFDHFAEFDKPKMEVIHKTFAQNAEEFDKMLVNANNVFPPVVLEVMKSVQDQWKTFKEVSEKVMALGEEFDKEESLYLLYGDNQKQFQQMSALFQDASVRLAKIGDDAYLRGQGIRGGAVRNMVLLAGLGTIVTIVLLTFLSRMIASPLKAVSDVIRHVASGDLTRKSSVEGLDEIGVLGHSVDTMSGSLRGIVSGLADHATTLASSSSDLNGITSGIAGQGKTLLEQAASVSSASTELATFVQRMAEGVERLSAHIQSISTSAQASSGRMAAVNGAVEEIAGSITRISNAADSAGSVARDAMTRSEDASHTMRQLGEAAQEIGTVTDAIKRIAHQTNLLALNANIEAASAGKAGAGFAVVANAIKALARQSALSAEEIATRIASIQERTEGAITAITAMTQIVEAINLSVRDIASAVRLQSQSAAGITANILEAAASSKEHASTVAEISRATQEMSTELQQASMAASVVSTTIDNVHRACGEVAQGIDQISGATGNLAKIGTDLRVVVNQFHYA